MLLSLQRHFFKKKIISHFLLSLDHKDKERDKKKEKKKEWKNHNLPPVHDIARENGEAISPQKGRDEGYGQPQKYQVWIVSSPVSATLVSKQVKVSRTC